MSSKCILRSFYPSNVEEISKQKEDIKTTLTEKEKYQIRKQIINVVPTYLYSKEAKNNIFISSNNNQQSQIEEFNKLKQEIISLERSIRHLEKAKKTKLAKVDNLRCVLRRIANEDSFTPFTPVTPVCDGKVNCFSSKKDVNERIN